MKRSLPILLEEEKKSSFCGKMTNFIFSYSLYQLSYLNKIFLVCCLVAEKNRDDFSNIWISEKEHVPKNRWLSMFGKIPLKEVNRLELLVLKAMGWNANISPEEFRSLVRGVSGDMEDPYSSYEFYCQ